MTLVKICGVRDPETALEAAKAGADFVGIVFAESKRKVTPQECYDIIEALKASRRDEAVIAGPQRGEVSARSWFAAWADSLDMAVARWRPLITGLFADQRAAEVNEIAEAAGLDLVQLSGGEDDDYVRSIKLPVIRAVHVAPGMDDADVVERAAPGLGAAILLDTAAAGSRGGTGMAFDWEVAAAVARRTPFLLAGGLTPENVADALGTVHPWAVDVSSGVETDGRKDIDKIRAFLRAAKGATVGG